MPRLVLEVTPGEDFYVRDERFVLIEIHDETTCTISRDHDGKAFRLSGSQRVEIAQDVAAFVGGRGQLGLARIAIEADRSIPVLRGKLYRSRPGPISN